jgi:hypothetical protein
MISVQERVSVVGVISLQAEPLLASQERSDGYMLYYSPKGSVR